jgi:diguanylate cyclase (GGDEF)-like protein
VHARTTHGTRMEPMDPAHHATAPFDDEALRLARELRGTIAELLQARRTVELQRDEILRLQTQDLLTGLPNRRTILERLRQEADEARRYAHPVALLLLDLDGFTALNRDHGMGIGDVVLREVALRLRLRMRAADSLGRVGADSFLALLPHTDEAGAAEFARALLERLTATPIETWDGELRLAASIGVAFMRPGISLSDDQLLAEADLALASARAAGGDRIAFDRMHGLLRLDARRPARQGGLAGEGGRAAEGA